MNTTRTGGATGTAGRSNGLCPGRNESDNQPTRLRHWLAAILMCLFGAVGLQTARAQIDGGQVGCIGFDTELLSLDLTGGPYPIPVGSDPGNVLFPDVGGGLAADGGPASVEGYSFVDCEVTITLSSQRALTPGAPSEGFAIAFPAIFEAVAEGAGIRVAGGRGEIQCDDPIDPDELDGQEFSIDSFFDVFFDITVTDVDTRPGRDIAGQPHGASLTFEDNGPANMQSNYLRIFDKDAPNFGLIPPPQSAPYIGHFQVVIPLGGDINGNGENDIVKFNLVSHAAGDANRTFIQLPDGTVLDEFDSAAFIEGAVLDESSDPPFTLGTGDQNAPGFGPGGLTGPTTASSTLQNPLVAPGPDFLLDFNSNQGGGGVATAGDPANPATPVHNEVGYHSYHINHESAPHVSPATAGSYNTSFFHTGPATVTVLPDWPNTTNRLVRQSIGRSGGQANSWTGNKQNLVRDFIGVDARTGNGGNGLWDGSSGTPTYMTLALGGLPAGPYGMTSFHHDVENMNSFFTIEISTDGGASYGSPINGRMTNSLPGGTPAENEVLAGTPPNVAGSEPADLSSTLSYTFDATGSDDVVLRFTPLPPADVNPVHQMFFGINGFELTQLTPPGVPEIFCADKIVVNAPAGGTAMVSYADIFAIDPEDGPVPVTCSPPDTTAFPIGSTTVTCTATDSHGQTTEASFEVCVLEIQVTPLARTPASVSLRGDAAPGAGGTAPGGSGDPSYPADATMFAYNHAYLNNSGQVSLEAILKSAGTKNLALFSDAGGPLAAIAVKDTGSPGGPDYVSFNELAIADDGNSAFVTRTTAGDSHVTDDGTSTTLLVGSAPPGLAGSPLVDIVFTPALSDAGRLFSPVRLEQGTGTTAVTVFNDTLIWDSDNGVVAREGEAAADQPVGVSYSHLASRVVANDNAQIAFSGNLTGAGGARTAVWSGAPGSLTVVAQRDDVAPGTGGATFATFLAESISPAGTVVVRSNLRFASGVVTSNNNEGLWSDRSGSLELVVREDDLAPCVQPDVRFRRFEAMFIDSGGRVVFYATLKGTGVNSTNDGSVWSSDPDGTLQLVAREGDIANNTDGGLYAHINPVATNDSGGVIMLARLVRDIGDTTGSNDVGLWRDPGSATQPVLQLLMRRGDMVDIDGSPERVSLVDIGRVTNPAGGTGGYGRVLNDAGAAVMKLSLTGNNGGVFTLP